MADLVGQTIGRYRIVASLGRGGMAQVYKAYHPGLNRYTAIKVLHGYLADDADFLKRFQREASAVASLRHQNIVQVFDFASQNDIYYMAMEFVKGPSLKEELQTRVNSDRPLTHTETGHIMVALGEAINYAHQNGMVHRDLKPGNFMLTSEGQILILDFGIAKIVDATKYTLTGAVTGTPAYMSPEQGQGERGDERSDIYSLGIVLYELMTGRVPFDADTPLAVIIKHMSDPLPLPRDIKPDIPEVIEQVILKALAKEPEDRFQSGSEFAIAIREAIGISPYDTLARNPVYPIFERPTVAELSPSDPTFQAKAAQLPTQVEAALPPSNIVTAPAPTPAVKRSNGLLMGGIGGGIALLLLIGFLLARSGFFGSGANSVSQVENTPTVSAITETVVETSTASATPTELPADTATPLAATVIGTTQATEVVPTAADLVATIALSGTSTLTPNKVALLATPTVEVTVTTVTVDTPTVTRTPTETAIPTATVDADGTFEARLNARETRVAQQTAAAAQTQTAEAPTATATATPSATPTVTDTASPTSTTTQTAIPTATVTPTNTPDIEATIEARFNLRATEFVAATRAAVETATAAAPTTTSTPTVTSSPTVTPTFTPASTATNTATPTVVNTPTNTPIPATPTPSATPTPNAPPISGKLAVPINNGGGGYDIIVFALPGGQQIAKIENARQPEFRADGLKMLVNGEGAGRDNIWQVDVASWHLEKAVSSSPSDYHPFYSPDGQRLVVGNSNLAIGADGNPHPYLFVQCGVRNPQEEGDEKCRELAHFGQLLPTGHIGEIHGESPVWTGDDLIVYKGCNTWQGGNSCGIFRVGSWANKRWSNGETPAKLSGIDGTDTIPTDASGSNFIYHDFKNNDWDLYISTTTGGPRNLSNSTSSSDILGTFSPDGQWVAFISNRDGGWAVWIVPVSGGTPTQLFSIPWQAPPNNHRIERMSWGL